MDNVHHVAIQVRNLDEGLQWYRQHFDVDTVYEDESWALLSFDNVKLALVTPSQHPPHIAVERPDAADYGTLSTHRDGTAYVYLNDPSGNSVEILLAPSTHGLESE